MLELVFFALGLGFLLIFFVRRTSSNVALEEDAEKNEGDREIQILRYIPADFFERVLKELLEDMGLRIVQSEWVNDEEIDILAHHPALLIGGDFIVHGILVPEGNYVNSIRVIGLSDTVRAERALKGILVTTGYFTEEVNKYAEGAPLELINVARLRGLLRERNIHWPSE